MSVRFLFEREVVKMSTSMYKDRLFQTFELVGKKEKRGPLFKDYSRMYNPTKNKRCIRQKKKKFSGPR